MHGNRRGEWKMDVEAPLLIIGAGPYGLGLGAFANYHGMEHLVVGKFMDSWHNNIPEGLSFRGITNWHFDSVGGHSIEDYLSGMPSSGSNDRALSSQFLLDYAEWFWRQKRINVLEKTVMRLNRKEDSFLALLDDGTEIKSARVVVALDMGQFPYLPKRLIRLFKQDRYEHTGKISDMAPLQGKRCLIVGNMRSVFEWSALLHENGARAVHISMNQSGPQVEESDWSWLNDLIDDADPNPAKFKSMSETEKAEINHRIWLEGRGKIEPSVKRRIKENATWIWPHGKIMQCWEHPDGSLKILLDCGDRLTIDFVLFATGYKVDTSSIPFIANGNILNDLEILNGYPKLDGTFQSNLPGLFFTSYPAARDFGEFFAYTMAVPISSKVIGNFLLNPSSES